jgi:LacI family transcriptional regulator
MQTKRRIGVVVDFMGSHGRAVLKGIAAYAHLASWELVTGADADIPWGPLDGMIASLHDLPTYRRVLSQGLPAVNVSTNMAGMECPSVITDNQAIGRLGASYLRSLELRSYAYVSLTEVVWSELRGTAFRDAMKEKGIDVHWWSMPQRDRSRDSTIKSLEEWVFNLPEPAGIFVASDDCALDFLKACQRIGFRIPEQAAVLGVDDDELINSLATPPLSTIDPNAYAVGYRASQMLDGLLGGDAPPAEALLIPPSGVIARLSTQNLALKDPEVAQAVRFIREHVTEPLNVADVLDVVPLSRRPLEKRFSRSVGCSILHEIHRVKIARAKRLLVESDLTVEGVAHACGFAGQTRLNIVFQKLTGVTAGQYRHQNASPAMTLTGHGG